MRATLWPVVLLGVSSCSGSKFPESGDVPGAQAKWCDTLAEIEGSTRSWDVDDCKGADTSASAAYLLKMADCFKQRVSPDTATDVSSLLTDCQAGVAVDLPAEDAAGKDALAARCERMERCEHIPASDCQEMLERMTGDQRASFTTMYNARALADVSDCLRSTGCADDEDAVRTACYQEHLEALLWLP